MFGTAELKFTPTQRLGSLATRLSQIKDGRCAVHPST
jgi:hypothetical protein